MTQGEGEALALVCLTIAIAGGAFALFGHTRSAVGATIGLALLFLGFAAPDLYARLWRTDAYIQQYGRAALSELPLTLAVAGLAFIALIGSTLAVVWRGWMVWVGWCANLPTVAMLVYFAFWFHVF